MKRLLAAGSGPIFEIGKAFRAGERGRLHSVEFAIAEWYRPGTPDALLAEMDLLLQDVLETPPAAIRTYRDVFRAATGTDPLTAEDALLDRLAEANGRPAPPQGRAERPDRADALDFLFGTVVQPGLGKARPDIVTRFPAPLAALARLDEDDPRTSGRFEVFVSGVELANGYDELTDPAEHRRRFESTNRARLRRGAPAAEPDPAFLAALEEGGLPRCAGVALGVDRLVMLALGETGLDAVVAFRP